MNSALAVASALAALGLAVVLIKQLYQSAGRPDESDGAGLDLFRDSILLIAAICGLAYLAIRLAGNASLPETEITDMTSYVDETQRLLIALLAFLICFGLSSAVIQGVFPDKGTRRNKIISEATALVLSLVLALMVATNDRLNARLSNLIEDRGGDAVYTFLVIVFAAIGAFLAWKRLSTVVRPTARTRGVRSKDSIELD